METKEKIYATMFLLGFFLAVPASLISDAVAGFMCLVGLVGGILLALSVIWGDW